MMRADIRRCRRCKRKRLDDEPLEVRQYKTCAKCRIIERNKKNSRKPLAQETMLYGLKQFREQQSTENYIEEEGLLKDEFFKRYHNKPFNYDFEIAKVLNDPNYVPPVITINSDEIPNTGATSPNGTRYQMTLRPDEGTPSKSSKSHSHSSSSYRIEKPFKAKKIDLKGLEEKFDINSNMQTPTGRNKFKPQHPVGETPSVSGVPFPTETVKRKQSGNNHIGHNNSSGNNNNGSKVPEDQNDIIKELMELGEDSDDSVGVGANLTVSGPDANTGTGTGTGAGAGAGAGAGSDKDGVGKSGQTFNPYKFKNVFHNFEKLLLQILEKRVNNESCKNLVFLKELDKEFASELAKLSINNTNAASATATTAESHASHQNPSKLTERQSRVNMLANLKKLYIDPIIATLALQLDQKSTNAQDYKYTDTLRSFFYYADPYMHQNLNQGIVNGSDVINPHRVKSSSISLGFNKKLNIMTIKISFTTYSDLNKATFYPPELKEAIVSVLKTLATQLGTRTGEFKVDNEIASNVYQELCKQIITAGNESLSPYVKNLSEESFISDLVNNANEFEKIVQETVIIGGQDENKDERESEAIQEASHEAGHGASHEASHVVNGKVDGGVDIEEEGAISEKEGVVDNQEQQALEEVARETVSENEHNEPIANDTNMEDAEGNAPDKEEIIEVPETRIGHNLVEMEIEGKVEEGKEEDGKVETEEKMEKVKAEQEEQKEAEQHEEVEKEQEKEQEKEEEKEEEKEVKKKEEEEEKKEEEEEKKEEEERKEQKTESTPVSELPNLTDGSNIPEVLKDNNDPTGDIIMADTETNVGTLDPVFNS